MTVRNCLRLRARLRVLDAHEEQMLETLTEAGLAEKAARLGRGGWRRGVLDLRRSRRARLAHRVCAMHGGGVCD